MSDPPDTVARNPSALSAIMFSHSSLDVRLFRSSRLLRLYLLGTVLYIHVQVCHTHDDPAIGGSLKSYIIAFLPFRIPYIIYLRIT